MLMLANLGCLYCRLASVLPTQTRPSENPCGACQQINPLYIKAPFFTSNHPKQDQHALRTVQKMGKETHMATMWSQERYQRENAIQQFMVVLPLRRMHTGQ